MKTDCMSIFMLRPSHLLALSICMLHASAEATSWYLGGVSSNVHVDENRVFFTQNDGSLTVIELETGEVVLRQRGKKSRDYGYVYSIHDGIVWNGYESVLLNRDTLEIQPYDESVSGTEADIQVHSPNLTEITTDAYGRDYYETDFVQFGVFRVRENDPGTPVKLKDGTLHSIVQNETLVLHYRSSEGEWFGALPYLRKFECVVTLAEYKGMLLLGTNSGYVECIELKSGRSLWIYAFPVLRWTFLGKSDPHWYGDAASAWHRNRKQLPRTIGMVSLPTNPGNIPGFDAQDFEESFTGRVILDPQPEERYPLFNLLWFAFWIPVWCLIAAIWIGPKRGPRYVRVPIFVVAWPTSVAGMIYLLLEVFAGHEPGYSMLHSIVWLVCSVVFGIMLFIWRSSRSLRVENDMDEVNPLNLRSE